MDLSVPCILAAPGLTPKHAIYAFIIYSPICALFVLHCEKNENKQKESGSSPLKKIKMTIEDFSIGIYLQNAIETPNQSMYIQIWTKHGLLWIHQGTFTDGGSITVCLVSSFTSFDSTASLLTNNDIFSFLVKSNLVKLETSRIAILPPTVTVLSIHICFRNRILLKHCLLRDSNLDR